MSNTRFVPKMNTASFAGLTAMVSTVLFAALFLGACSEEKKLERRLVMHPNNSVWKEWHIERKPTGDTLIQGPFKEFFWNGSPAASTQFSEGLKEGSSQAWYDNNTVKWTKVYAKDKPTGTWNLFTREGKRWMTVTYNEAGQLHGPAKVWDRIEINTVHEALFTDGSCTEGACPAFLDPAIPADLPEAAKQALIKDQEIVKAFLE